MTVIPFPHRPVSHGLRPRSAGVLIWVSPARWRRSRTLWRQATPEPMSPPDPNIPRPGPPTTPGREPPAEVPVEKPPVELPPADPSPIPQRLPPSA